jgi:CubicO group peptidase (beta-lactamase class C family)
VSQPIAVCFVLLGLGTVAGADAVRRAEARQETAPSVSAMLGDQAIRNRLRDHFDRTKRGVGIVVGTIDQTGTQIVAHGRRHSQLEGAVDGDSVFEIGSITKMFTTTLLADMVERGEFGLDDPLSMHLPPGVRAPTKAGKAITLQHLATHTSGLPHMPSNFFPWLTAGKGAWIRNDSPWWLLFCPVCISAPDRFARYSTDQMYAALSSYRLTREPGVRYQYSNWGMAILGDLLARRAGTNYDTLVRTRILQPLNMRSTAGTMSSEMQARLASGHTRTGKPQPNWVLRQAFMPAGGLLSTANDMLKFVGANVDVIASPIGPAAARARQRLHTIQVAGPTQLKMDIGLGWEIVSAFDSVFVLHTGETGGYETCVVFDPDRRRGVVVLANSLRGGDQPSIGRLALHVLDPRFSLPQAR